MGVGSLERRLQQVFRGELRCERLPVSINPTAPQVIHAGAQHRCTLGDRDRSHTVFTSTVARRYPWDFHPVEDWLRLARVSEVVVRAPG